MKHKYIAFSLALLLMLSGCGSKDMNKTSEVSTPETTVEEEMPNPSATPQKTEKPRVASPTNTPKKELATLTEKPAAEQETTSTQTAAPAPAAEPAPAPTAVSTAAPAAAPAVVSMSYGEIPFNLSAGSDQWWLIDSSDSAYWAVQENINAIRAAGGLGALSMSDGLSASANTRCENFVSGGAFDHSGMITKSEICAQGPIGSASAVCNAWQGSPDHYANIMRSDISSMGVACWFCTVDGNNYTYWVVTFE